MNGATIFLIINVVLALICFAQNKGIFYAFGAFLILEGVGYFYYSKRKEKSSQVKK